MIKKTVNKEKFGKRLTLLMDTNHETTYSMAEKFSLSSPTISRYMTGQMAAKITTIEMMAKYFGVNPVWLMGFDVPQSMDIESINPPEIMSYYEQLNELGKEIATEHVRLLTLDKKYTTRPIQQKLESFQVLNAAQKRTDIEIPEGIDTSENDIMKDDNF